MPAYLLDTNHASPLVTPGHPLRSRFLEAVAAGDTFGIAVVCLTEVVFGLGVLPKARANRTAWSLLVRDLTIHEIGQPQAEAAAELQISLRKQGWQLGTVDALTAVVALQRDLILLSTDSDFSRVPGLRRENWLRP